VETFDVAIVGGGVIGCSIAFELASEKLKILLLDKQEPGREASWAAAGMLSPAPESSKDIPLVPLSRKSLRLYPEFVSAIENDSGKVCGYLRKGTLQVFGGADALRERDDVLGEHQSLGLNVEAISIEKAREKGLSSKSSAQAVAFLPEEGSVEPRLLMEALLSAVVSRGAEIRPNCEVSSMWTKRNRCIGVQADQKIAAKHVVLAAGCFSAAVAEKSEGLDRLAPTRPVRGQMVALKRRGFRLERVIRSEKGYIVPRTDGRVVAGSTVEEAGFEKRVTADGIRAILDTAIELSPELGAAEVVETWSGLRPGTPDGLPILGPTGIEGLIIATGHYRNGMLLAPITANLVRQWIFTGRTDFKAEQFSPSRFARELQENALQDTQAR
jgi:glycine oxidase